MLLAISPATADRLLRPLRQGERKMGIGATRAGSLLRYQIPIRTFAEWDYAEPCFFEADLVAHRGTSEEGAFLQTLTLTDVATGWTECLPLLYRAQHAALDRADVLLPFPIRSLDTDNGGEFLNAEILAYCEERAITFTRGRFARKNDQCFVEQKNGSIVRHFVGYDRFEGEIAYRQLGELYRVLRLYVNFFQPSMKLKAKRRDGSSVRHSYDHARTPYQRVLAASVVDAETSRRLEVIARALDPVRLLHQIDTLQDALWRHAIVGLPATKPTPIAAPAVCFAPNACGGGEDRTVAEGPSLAELVTKGRTGRRYHRAKKPKGPRTYRTRKDPFEAVWEQLVAWLSADPERTAKSAFDELQRKYPGTYPPGQLRTLERHAQEWRKRTIVPFDDHWLPEEPRPDLRLLASPVTRPSVTGSG